MICEGCRLDTARVHVSDHNHEPVRYWHFCGVCAPPFCVLVPWIERQFDLGLPAPRWACASCGEEVEPGLPITKSPSGELLYRHRACPVPDGWEVVPTSTVKRVVAATPEVAEILGIPYEEPPERTGLHSPGG